MWKTNVFIAYDGNEKRESIRQFPRLSYLYTIPINAEFKRSHIYHSIYKGLALNDWLIPMWWEMQKVSIAGSVITVDARPWPLAVGDRLFTVDFVRHHSFSVNEITAITDTSITVSGTIPDMRLPRSMPIRVGYIDNRASLQTLGGFIGDAQILFTLSEPVRLATDEIVGTGAPVYNEPYLSSGRVSKQISQTISTVDYGRLVARRERWDAPKAYYEMGFRQHNLCDHAGFRKFLYQQRGRERPFWLPSFETDLVPVRDSTAIGTTLKVRDYSYNDTDMHRNCIAIKDVKGDWHYRKITANDTTAGVVSLTLDTALALRHEQINYISYLGKHRITSDRIQIDHGQAVIKECSLRVAEIEACGDETSWYSRVITTGCHARALPPEGSYSNTAKIPPYIGEGSGPGPVAPPPPPGEEIGPRDVYPVLFPNPTITVNGEERDDYFAPGDGYELKSMDGTASRNNVSVLYAARGEAVYAIGKTHGQLLGPQIGFDVSAYARGVFWAFLHWTSSGVRNVWYMISAYDIDSVTAGPGGIIYASGNQRGGTPFLLIVRPPPKNQTAIDAFFQGGIDALTADRVYADSSLRSRIVLVGVPTMLPNDYGHTYTSADQYGNYTVRIPLVDAPVIDGSRPGITDIVAGRGETITFLKEFGSLSTSTSNTYRIVSYADVTPVVGSRITLNYPSVIFIGGGSLRMFGEGSGFASIWNENRRYTLRIWSARGGNPSVTEDITEDTVGPQRGGNLDFSFPAQPGRNYATNTSYIYVKTIYNVGVRGVTGENRGFTVFAAYSRSGVRTPQADIPWNWYAPSS